MDYWLGQEGTMKTTWYGIEGRDWEYTDEYESLVGETPSILIKASLEGAGNTDVPGAHRRADLCDQRDVRADCR